jgi:hypothetical protein
MRNGLLGAWIRRARGARGWETPCLGAGEAGPREFLDRLAPPHTSTELRLAPIRHYEAIMPDHGGDAESTNSTVRQVRMVREATSYGVVGYSMSAPFEL